MDVLASLISNHTITFDPLSIGIIYVMARFNTEMANLKIAVAVLQTRLNDIAPQKTVA